MGNVFQGMQAPGMPGAPPAAGAPGITPPPLPGAAPPIMFSIAVNGQSAGPFSMDQLIKMAQAGQFTKESMVWRQGMPAWAAAGTVPELAGIFAPAPPPAPSGPPPVPPVQK